ncbi:MAG TPA: DUF1622 domain-containing protein [Gemmatimonadaceae bacterium]
MTETLPALLTFYGAVRNALEFLGALSIVAGAILTLVKLVRPLRAGQHVSVTNSRFQLSRYLTLALEFQLSSDVLGTAIAPSWTAIGKLAAIGAIRTALNYFLTREIEDERVRLASVASGPTELPQSPDVTRTGE